MCYGAFCPYLCATGALPYSFIIPHFLKKVKLMLCSFEFYPCYATNEISITHDVGALYIYGASTAVDIRMDTAPMTSRCRTPSPPKAITSAKLCTTAEAIVPAPPKIQRSKKLIKSKFTYFLEATQVRL